MSREHALFRSTTVTSPLRNVQVYAAHFVDEEGRPHVGSGGRPPPGAPHLLGSTPEIEELRPQVAVRTCFGKVSGGCVPGLLVSSNNTH